ncbi:unnamed protein product [Pleuronectes platessa]|uniref:Uncharacterized protein n=1 Tax=Pleuronectes platessa TaxID=8262 RepID=A0A9N7TMY3_PLEPL|nr:unnamed protein product [Pleuronectes platessa]
MRWCVFGKRTPQISRVPRCASAAGPGDGSEEDGRLAETLSAHLCGPGSGGSVKLIGSRCWKSSGSAWAAPNRFKEQVLFPLDDFMEAAAKTNGVRWCFPRGTPLGFDPSRAPTRGERIPEFPQSHFQALKSDVSRLKVKFELNSWIGCTWKAQSRKTSKKHFLEKSSFGVGGGAIPLTETLSQNLRFLLVWNQLGVIKTIWPEEDLPGIVQIYGSVASALVVGSGRRGRGHAVLRSAAVPLAAAHNAMSDARVLCEVFPRMSPAVVSRVSVTWRG